MKITISQELSIKETRHIIDVREKSNKDFTEILLMVLEAGKSHSTFHIGVKNDLF
ncbi:MAG: hypothetical protein AB7S48_17240 [Bacteroidales bacterium]